MKAMENLEYYEEMSVNDILTIMKFDIDMKANMEKIAE